MVYYHLNMKFDIEGWSDLPFASIEHSLSKDKYPRIQDQSL